MLWRNEDERGGSWPQLPAHVMAVRLGQLCGSARVVSAVSFNVSEQKV